MAAVPGDLRLRSDWALTYTNLAAVQSRNGDFAEAADAYEQAITIQTQLVAMAPNQKNFRRDLAVSYNNRGLFQSRLGESVQAEQSFVSGLDLQKALVVQYPDDLDLQSSLGGVYNNLGIVLEEQKRIEDAAVAYKRAIEHQRLAFSHATDVARYRSFLSKHYFNYGRTLRHLGFPDQAARAAMARRELWPRDPQHLWAIAEELALAGAVMPADGAGDITSSQCADWALETLQLAVSCGWQLPDKFDSKPSFAWLRQHDGFTRFTQALPQ